MVEIEPPGGNEGHGQFLCPRLILIREALAGEPPVVSQQNREPRFKKNQGHPSSSRSVTLPGGQEGGT
jgi:hypothetical protein